MDEWGKKKNGQAYVKKQTNTKIGSTNESTKNIKKRETKKLKDQIKINADKFGLSIDVIKELQKLEEENVLVKKIKGYPNTVSMTGMSITLTNGATYTLYANYNAIELEARDKIIHDLAWKPEIYDHDFLRKHITVDKHSMENLIDGEVDNYIEDKSDQKQLEIERELIEELSEQKHDDGFEQKLNKLADEKLDEWRITAYDERKSKISSEIKKDPVGYFVNKRGIDERDSILQEPWVQIDKDAATDAIIEADGPEHFLPSYEGYPYKVYNGHGQYLVKHLPKPHDPVILDLP